MFVNTNAIDHLLKRSSTRVSSVYVIMQTPGYYALPLRALPMDVYQNFNKLTLFSRPNNRLIRLANEIVTNGPVLAKPSTPSFKTNNDIKVQLINSRIMNRMFF